jgi:hypothetical protein
MASVRLDFVPPSIPDVKTLLIEEAVDSSGPFSEIEQITAVGIYPDYISYYTTQLANSTTDWFRIRWETSDGVFTEYSQPWQGGTTLLVNEIVNRVLLRNPALNEIVVTQEAAAVVSEVFNTQDPWSMVLTDATYVQLRGCVNLTLARSLVATYLASGGTVSKFTAGLVSLQSGATTADPTKAIKALIDAANADLGLSYSVVLLMSDVESSLACGGNGSLHGVDLTRSVAMIDYGALNR